MGQRDFDWGHLMGKKSRAKEKCQRGEGFALGHGRLLFNRLPAFDRPCLFGWMRYKSAKKLCIFYLSRMFLFAYFAKQRLFRALQALLNHDSCQSEKSRNAIRRSEM